MVRDELSVLSAFLAVAEERSFTRAAKHLVVTPSALSHAIRELVERFGVRLLARTTRSVAPTDAGAQLVARLRPALGDIRCINVRHGSDGVYRWEFDKGKQSLTVAVNGPLIVDDVQLSIRAAIDGVGLAFVDEDRVAPHLASGALVLVLEDWCPPFPGFFLYYPSQRQLRPALSALIETLRLRPGKTTTP